jgi:hypothetical protein
MDHHELAVIANLTLIALAGLVILSILFEKFTDWAKERVMERFEEAMPVLSCLFKELSILGFLGLCAFGLEKSGALESLSEKYFDGDKEELPERFEDIHMALFLVMVLFLVTGVVLIFTLEQREADLRHCERLTTPCGHSLPSLLDDCRGLLASPPRPATCNWTNGKDMTRAQTRMAINFMAMRYRFIASAAPNACATAPVPRRGVLLRARILSDLRQYWYDRRADARSTHPGDVPYAL